MYARQQKKSLLEMSWLFNTRQALSIGYDSDSPGCRLMTTFVIAIISYLTLHEYFVGLSHFCANKKPASAYRSWACASCVTFVLINIPYFLNCATHYMFFESIVLIIVLIINVWGITY